MLRPVPPTAPLTAGIVPLAEFWGSLRIAQWTPVLTGNTVQSTTEGGEVIAAQRGARLWRWSVTLAPMAREDADVLAGRFDVLAEGLGVFLATPPFRQFPRLDPQGLFLAGAAPVIASLPAGGRTLTLSGLPGHYRITPGDWLSFAYGTPSRQALHRVVSGAVATAAGDLPAIEVSPALRLGAVVGAAVTLRQPVMRARMVPGTFRAAQHAPGLATGPSFDLIQTLRG